jgi:hypothetical protein
MNVAIDCTVDNLLTKAFFPAVSSYSEHGISPFAIVTRYDAPSPLFCPNQEFLLVSPPAGVLHINYGVVAPTVPSALLH